MATGTFLIELSYPLLLVLSLQNCPTFCNRFFLMPYHVSITRTINLHILFFVRYCVAVFFKAVGATFGDVMFYIKPMHWPFTVSLYFLGFANTYLLLWHLKCMFTNSINLIFYSNRRKVARYKNIPLAWNRSFLHCHNRTKHWNSPQHLLRLLTWE